MSTCSDILARARRPQNEANYLLHSTPLFSCSSWRLLSHCSVWSLPAVWQHSPVWLTIKRDADRRSERVGVLCASHRTNFNRVVQPTRTTGVKIKDVGDAVNQTGAGGGRIAHLNFYSYQQSQGGKYECRVVGPGNNLERLAVCIGECHAWGDGCGL